jgi:hypothetical protein
MRLLRLAVIGICSLWCLLSCGLEAFYYIDYIPLGTYDDTRASVRLPSSSAEGYSTYFSNFIIFYRIYISGERIPTGTYLRDSSNDRNTINMALNSDYVGLDPFTDITSTTVNTENLESTFLNRKYFQLTLESAEINNVLGKNSLGEILDFAFPPNTGVMPTLILRGTAYTLRRADREKQSLLAPRPDRYFLNHPDLYNNANVTNEINADVAANTRGNPRYTYVSLYIAAKGVSLEMPPRDIYSQPTFIGIFLLAESN